jgi:hypothetical protein
MEHWFGEFLSPSELKSVSRISSHPAKLTWMQIAAILVPIDDIGHIWAPEIEIRVVFLYNPSDSFPQSTAKFVQEYYYMLISRYILKK